MKLTIALTSALSLVFAAGMFAQSFAPTPAETPRHQATGEQPIYVGEAKISDVGITYVHDTASPATCLAVVRRGDAISVTAVPAESCTSQAGTK